MQNNLAYYLKYRPQTLMEIIGQEVVTRNLFLSYQNNKLSHAYLFFGPRGTGKTSTARILAKMVNCEKQSSVVSRQSSDQKSLKADSEASLKTDSYPCNKCQTCMSITDGSNLDLIEIDAASNRGIEDIRVLRERINLAPSKAKKKVYIIDEVHMLTTEAFNALLKTLEEPPEHAMFILATTELGKIPQTILSRVQRLDFKLASTEELLEALTKIVKKEKIDIDEDSLKMLIKKAEGSFRDGVKLLDQVSSIKGKITVKTIEDNFKSLRFENILEIIAAFKNSNTGAVLLNVRKQIDSGMDVKELILSLMDALRNLVFIKNELGEQLVKPNFTEDKYNELVKIAESFSILDLVADLGFLQKALEKLKFASIPSLPLELAVVEICGEQPSAVSFQPASTRGELSAKQESQAMPVIIDSPSTSNSPDIAKIKEKWTFVLETIRPYNFSLEALLRSTNISSCSDNEVIMEVPYSFHQRILEAPKNRDLLESIFSDILGRSIRIATILGNRPQSREDVANIEVAADDEIIRVAAAIFESESVN